MKATIYLNGKKVTKKAAIEKLGKELFDRYMREAWEEFQEEPGLDLSRNTIAGMLSIEFGY